MYVSLPVCVQGSIPYPLLSLGSLTYLSLAGQWMFGSLPSSLG